MTLSYGETADAPPMRGADGARNQLADFLVDVLPDKIEALRLAFGYDTGLLPDVGKVSSGELPESAISSIADAWVEVINPRMLPGLRRVDISPAGDPVYQVRYACRIYVWALGLDWDMSLARRDHVCMAVKLALLEFPTLARAGGDTGWCVLEETWVEEYGIPARVPNQGNQSGRCWCSGSLSVDVRAEEVMSAGRLRVPIGMNNSTLLSTTVVAPTEEIPHDLPRPPGWVTPEIDNEDTTGDGGVIIPPDPEPDPEPEEAP